MTSVSPAKKRRDLPQTADDMTSVSPELINIDLQAIYVVSDHFDISVLNVFDLVVIRCSMKDLY